jgi:menaquinone-dependent protoporphyrinogen oxidase
MRNEQMKVLVTAGSKHGATAEIAQVVGQVLAEHGYAASVLAPEQVGAVADYQAYVIGSAIYAGRWRPEARDLVERHAELLRTRPVWLFSSGPVGDPPKPAEDPADAAVVVEAVSPREHRVFPGRLDRSQLSLVERGVVRALRVPYGDYRDWDAVRSWAESIAGALDRAGSRAD